MMPPWGIWRWRSCLRCEVTGLATCRRIERAHNAPDSVAAWEAKESALAEAGDRAALQAHFKSAIEAFRRQDDLKVRYQARLAELERDGGDARVAQRLSEQMVRENRRQRADLSAAAGSESLSRLLAAGDYEGAMRAYRDLTSKLGRTGGGNLFYDVVRPFVLELRAAGREQDAQRALQRARERMRFEKDSILAKEFAELESGSAGSR